MACIPVCGQHEAGLSIGFINSSNPDRIAEGKANAHLIVAAPDLLETLEGMVSLFPDGVEDDGSGAIGFNESLKSKYRAAVKAIAKARGEA